MEDINLRFPILSKKIFGNLDSKNLTKSTGVSQSWQMCINERKYFWIRMILTIGTAVFSNFDLTKGLWRSILRRASVNDVKELAFEFQDVIAKEDPHDLEGYGPLHYAAGNNQVQMIDYLIKTNKIVDVDV